MSAAVATLLAAALPAVASAQTAAPAQTAQAPAVPAHALSERVLGKADAPVTIIDYSSMTCPHCATFHTDVLPKIKEKYIDTGKVKLVFRDFPLDRVALAASAMARCAPEERYFPLLDVLFKSQSQWARASDPTKALSQYGKLAGMQQATIDACIADQTLADGILKFRMQGTDEHKVQSTPTFVLNDGTKIEGAQSIETFSAAIDKLL
nr:DsbA family protein [Azospirillum sp. SYSU D00513]